MGMFDAPGAGSYFGDLDEGPLARLLRMGQDPTQQSLLANPQFVRPDATGPYSTTLAPDDEAAFRQWTASNKVPFNPDAKGPQDYDMRGFYRGLKNGDPHAHTGANANDGKLHFSDYWKTPYHQSFSAESQWANPETAPRWNEQDQLVTPGGQVVFDEKKPYPHPAQDYIEPPPAGQSWQGQRSAAHGQSMFSSANAGDEGPLSRLLRMAPSGGDPEAILQGQASSAMEPVTGGYLHDVATGGMAQRGLQSMTGAYQFDPNMSAIDNARTMARDPAAMDQATNIAMSVGPGSIKAYHGSPHDFDQFDISKIGTGEGAQAYGHGLYFAENEGIARGYRDSLSAHLPPTVEIYGERYHPDELSGSEALAARAALTYSSPLGWKQYIRRNASNDGEGVDAMKLLREKAIVPADAGHMYEVNINAEPGDFLNWDKPLSEQGTAVQKMALEQLGHHKRLWESMGDTQRAQYIAKQEGNPPTDLYAPFSPEASKQWADRGIPGIKYLDQGSRNAGGWHITPPDQTVSGKWMVKSSDYNSKGLHFDTEAEAQAALAEKTAGQTSNYAVFDDKLIEILRKYGLAGVMGGAGAAGASFGALSPANAHQAQ